MTTLHMHLDSPVQKRPLRPSNSRMCPRTAPKGLAKGAKFVVITC